MTRHLFFRELKQRDLLDAARIFCGERLHEPNLTGPVLGERIESVFLSRLRDCGFDIADKQKAGVDVPELNCDIKSLQVRGKRGGAAKIHGYSKGGEPNYDLLVFTYTYDGTSIVIDAAFFITRQNISWVRAEHYLFSLPDSRLQQFKI